MKSKTNKHGLSWVTVAAVLVAITLLIFGTTHIHAYNPLPSYIEIHTGARRSEEVSFFGKIISVRYFETILPSAPKATETEILETLNGIEPVWRRLGHGELGMGAFFDHFQLIEIVESLELPSEQAKLARDALGLFLEKHTDERVLVEAVELSDHAAITVKVLDYNGSTLTEAILWTEPLSTRNPPPPASSPA